MTDARQAKDDNLALMREITGRARPQDAHIVEGIRSFLSKQHDLGGRLVDIVVDKTPRSSGASSGTVLFDARIKDKAGQSRTLPLVFRYDLGGAFFFQYDLIPQFAIMRALNGAGYPAPQALWLDRNGDIAGKPGLFMRRVDAPLPGGQPFAQGPLADAAPQDRRTMILNAVRCFARLHRLDPEAIGVEFLQRRGEGATFIERAIGWDGAELLHALPLGFGGDRQSYYEAVRSDLLQVRDHLLATMPRDRRPELVHGDPNLSNVMYRGTDIAAVLDWELSHLGLGEADLAYCMAGMAHFLLTLDPIPGIPSEDELIETYAAARGGVRDWEFCRLWGEWRLAIYQVMAFSRLPPEMQHLEEMYWRHSRGRLSQSIAL